MTGNIFVTGGAGFIGSHTALCLLENDYTITVVDNLDNSFELAIERVAELAGEKAKNMKFVTVDLRDFDALDRHFAETKYD
jgi:UDP-glucose 4-epimerase